MSKRLIVLVVTGVLIPLAVQYAGISVDVAWVIAVTVLGYFGMETVRPSGTIGVMGTGGSAPGN